MKDIIVELKRRLAEAVRKNGATGLLFSGGLDSAILASIDSKIKAITVNLKSHGEDVNYATSMAKFLNIEHYQKIIVAINETIRIIKQIDKTIKEYGGWPIK